MNIREFLDEQIKVHQAAVAETASNVDAMVAALEGMYRRQQLVGALNTLIQLRNAIADEQPAGETDV